MITEKDKSGIIGIAKKYNVSKILLFGSSVSKEGRDIDLAVDGLPASKFFEFYGELIFNLSKPVDLIDLSRKTSFSRMVASDAVLLYG